MTTSSLTVTLWDKEVGRLSWDSKRGVAYFEYNRDFLNGNLDIFPLEASIKNPLSRRPIIGDKETKIYRKLPPFIADSLPDAWGNSVFEYWRIQNNIKNQDITPLDILSFIGKRGMGALEFKPESSGIKKTEHLNMKALTDLAERIFKEREKALLSANDSFTMQSLIAVGIPAGGRQPKAIIAINNETGEIRSGQITELDGFDYHILKFGDPERCSSELEMAYYEMATEAGINMMDCHLLEFDGRKHFITKRFDRKNGRKLHLQTLAALCPEADSYERLMSVCRRMRLSESTQEEVFRRMVFNILSNNTDDHNKNFSFIMDENGKWSLSPAYDLTYIFNMGGYLPDNMHCITMRGKYSDFTKEDAIDFAKENGIKDGERIIYEVATSVSKFRTFAQKHKVAERWIGNIEQTLSAHLEKWEMLSPRPLSEFDINNQHISNIHIQQAYKGNYHIFATINGKSRKFVIGKNKEEHAIIERIGITKLTEEEIKEIMERYLERKPNTPKS